MKYITYSLIITFIAGLALFNSTGKGVSMPISSTVETDKPTALPTAYLAGGCFWCLESQVRALEGVIFTQAGYQGGHTPSPTYQQVSSGSTGHTEVVEVTYNPNIISYEELITFFLTKGHDATQLNRQGVDKGTQYRSAIFYADADEKAITEDVIAKINASDYYKSAKVVTEIAPLNAHPFWLAEEYHQQYYEKYEASEGETHIRVKMKKKRAEFKAE